MDPRAIILTLYRPTRVYCLDGSWVEVPGRLIPGQLRCGPTGRRSLMRFACAKLRFIEAFSRYFEGLVWLYQQSVQLCRQTCTAVLHICQYHAIHHLPPSRRQGHQGEIDAMMWSADTHLDIMTMTCCNINIRMTHSSFAEELPAAARRVGERVTGGYMLQTWE